MQIFFTETTNVFYPPDNMCSAAAVVIFYIVQILHKVNAKIKLFMRNLPATPKNTRITSFLRAAKCILVNNSILAVARVPI
jgi:hypothetical protein